MATFTWTYMPLLMVVQNGGSMNLVELTSKLNAASQRHFRDMAQVEFAIKTYSGCLKIINGNQVVFDRSAESYAKHSIMERDVDYLLHEAMPNLASRGFELYPHKTPQNSSVCPVGVPWKDVPKDSHAQSMGGDPYEMCDYHGKKGCQGGCGVREGKLRELGLI